MPPASPAAAQVSGRRREAYAQLLTTARKALEQARLRQATVGSTGEIDNLFILSPDDLAQVVALAELLGSPQSHPRVQAIYDKATALNHSPSTSTSELETAIHSFVDSVRPELGD